MKMCSTRKLKVKAFGDFYQQRTGKQAPKSRIDLAGNWLLEAGFMPGDKVTVLVEEQQLIVSLEEPTR